jgi:hypothetical protein
MAYRFNVPPGWPVRPGWTPPANWQAPPEWPSAPPDWQWWVAAEPTPPVPLPTPAPPTPAPPPPIAAPQLNHDLQLLLSTPIAAVGASESNGFNRKARLEAQVTAVQEFANRLQRALIATVGELQTLGALDTAALAVETDRRRAMIAHLDTEAAARKAAAQAQAQDQLHQIALQATAANTELHRTRLELAEAKQSLVVTRDEALLQEVGVYEYTHPLEDAVAYKARLESIKAQYKSLAKGDKAISSISNWQVNGSAAAGRKMIREFSKLMLRAYNADADNLVHTMRPYKFDAAVDRLQKARETITRLGSTMDMRITDASHRLRVQELQLTADYKARTEEEKERIREQRALEVVTGAPSIEGSTLSSNLVL